MRNASIVALLLVLVLLSLSSGLRLEHSGIGCTPWPACYGNIGATTEEVNVDQAYERLLADATRSMSWARPLHRLVAGVLGLLILGMTVMALIRRERRLPPLLLLGLTVFLAWLGIYSEGLHRPAIVMGNLAGGFAMLGILGWMVFDIRDRAAVAPGTDKLKRWASIAIIVLSLQILVGGITSANFAATACLTLPDCHGAWLPGKQLWAAFDLSRALVTTDSGFVVGGQERQAIHILHRLLSVITLTFVVTVGVLAIRVDRRRLPAGVFVCAVVMTQMLSGIMAVRFGIPIAVAVSHNWMAALLLLGLLRIRAEC